MTVNKSEQLIQLLSLLVSRENTSIILGIHIGCSPEVIIII